MGLDDGALGGSSVHALLIGVAVCARPNRIDRILHTSVRLPPSVFAPYTGITTNLIFVEKTGPTKDIWFYAHPLPEGRKELHEDAPTPIRGSRLWGAQTRSR
jgi:hypothetical protein